MGPTWNIEITGTVTRMGVTTEGEEGGAVLVATVEEDTTGGRLPAEQVGRAWLRFPPHAVEHLVSRYTSATNPFWLYATTANVAAWLDRENGTDPHETLSRVLKVGEEFGEAAAAYIGTTGQNPRKGTTHTVRDVADELADVVLAALVAMNSLGLNAETVMAGRVDRVNKRMAAARRDAADRVVA